jgi:hypothetical protein
VSVRKAYCSPLAPFAVPTADIRPYFVGPAAGPHSGVNLIEALRVDGTHRAVSVYQSKPARVSRFPIAVCALQSKIALPPRWLDVDQRDVSLSRRIDSASFVVHSEISSASRRYFSFVAPLFLTRVRPRYQVPDDEQTAPPCVFRCKLSCYP